MSSVRLRTAPLGELIVALFDEAARYGRSPEEVSRLASRALRHLLGDPARMLATPRPTAPLVARSL